MTVKRLGRNSSARPRGTPCSREQGIVTARGTMRTSTTTGEALGRHAAPPGNIFADSLRARARSSPNAVCLRHVGTGGGLLASRSPAQAGRGRSLAAVLAGGQLSSSRFDRAARPPRPRGAAGFTSSALDHPTWDRIHRQSFRRLFGRSRPSSRTNSATPEKYARPESRVSTTGWTDRSVAGPPSTRWQALLEKVKGARRKKRGGRTRRDVRRTNRGARGRKLPFARTAKKAAAEHWPTERRRYFGGANGELGRDFSRLFATSPAASEIDGHGALPGAVSIGAGSDMPCRRKGAPTRGLAGGARSASSQGEWRKRNNVSGRQERWVGVGSEAQKRTCSSAGRPVAASSRGGVQPERTAWRLRAAGPEAPAGRRGRRRRRPRGRRPPTTARPVAQGFAQTIGQRPTLAAVVSASGQGVLRGTR